MKAGRTVHKVMWSTTEYLFTDKGEAKRFMKLITKATGEVGVYSVCKLGPNVSRWLVYVGSSRASRAVSHGFRRYYYSLGHLGRMIEP